MTLMVMPQKQRGGLRLLFSSGGDEDMKIVGDSFSPLPAEDPAETEARRFLKQKSVGNIEKARELGKIYAQAVVDMTKNSPLDSAADGGQMEFHHQLVLCSYVVNRVIAERSPHSILAQTSLRVFYDEVERASTVMYTHVSDPAALSLYTLWERSRSRDEDEIGRIYAKLCGQEGNCKTIQDGNALSRWFYGVCTQYIENTAYTEVE
jgi:hypothetical protein